MSNIERLRAADGSIEAYGASTKLNEELESNFVERGRTAAALLALTLSETPYRPVIDGRRFEIEVSNVYRDGRHEEADTKDTVLVARDALEEFVHADVPGTKRIGLDSYRTRYKPMLRRLTPGIRTGETLHRIFDESLVEAARDDYELPLESAEEAFKIIHEAPKRLEALRLTDHYGSRYRDSMHDAVTSDGRMIQVRSIGRGDFMGIGYALPRRQEDRRVTPPRPYVASQISDRVIYLRTKHTSR